MSVSGNEKRNNPIKGIRFKTKNVAKNSKKNLQSDCWENEDNLLDWHGENAHHAAWHYQRRNNRWRRSSDISLYRSTSGRYCSGNQKNVGVVIMFTKINVLQIIRDHLFTLTGSRREKGRRQRILRRDLALFYAIPLVAGVFFAFCGLKLSEFIINAVCGKHHRRTCGGLRPLLFLF